MKKFGILSATILFLLAFTEVQAKNVKQTALKSEIKSSKESLKTERKELRRIDEKEVSELSKDNLYADFGNVADLKWTRTNYCDVASFMQNGKEIKAFYDDHSALIGTTSQKTFADLPLKAQNTIKKEYRKYRIGDVLYFEDNQNNDTDMILWDKQFEDADNYFVELRSPHRHLIVQVDPEGEVFFFKQL